MTTSTTTSILSLTNDPGRKPILTANWHDLLLEDQMFYFAAALDNDNSARVFTIQFTLPTRRRVAESSMSAKHYLAQRLRDKFKADVSYAFVLEATNKGVMHIHGVMDPRELNDDIVRAGLKKVAGDKRKLRTSVDKYFYNRHSVDYRPVDWTKTFEGRKGACGFLQYSLKDLKKTERLLETSKSLVCVTHDIKRLAKKLHKKDVDAALRLSAA